MFGNGCFRNVRSSGTGSVQECPARTAGLIHNLFGQFQEITGIIGFFIADDIDQSPPAPANADYFVTFSQCTDSDSSNGGIQAGDVAAAC